jgi:hypothetical protein
VVLNLVDAARLGALVLPRTRATRPDHGSRMSCNTSQT